MPDWIVFPLVGLAVGTYGTIIGAGGGFLFVPLLLLVWKLPHEQAIGTSLFVVSLSALSGTAVYLKQKRIDYRSAILFLIAGVPGAVLGARVPAELSTRMVLAVFGLLLAALGVWLTLHPERRAAALAADRGPEPAVAPGRSGRVLVDAQGTRYEWSFRESHGIALSFVLGFVSSILGIGGGIIHVPAMTHLFHFPAHVATATSHLVLAATALIGSISHARLGNVVWGPALLLATGAVVGAQIGGRIAPHVSGRWVIRALALALVVLSARLLWSAAD